jgi:phosphinothricin acetyltransferase
MRIRPATQTDLPAILEIYNEAILNTTATADYEPHTLAMRAEWFEQRLQKGYPVLVAEENGMIIGWSSLSPYHVRPGYRFTAEVSIYVRAEWRSKGVGSAMLPALIEAGRERGLYALIAGIDAENTASIRLHLRNGFEQVGRLKRAIYKFGRWLDLVFMELLLEPAPVIQ